MPNRPSRFFTALLTAFIVDAAAVVAEPVRVRHTEGLVHGFLSLKSLDGTLLADGDLLQSAVGSRVTSRLVFHFKDGSLHDETAVYSQRQQFRLISDHLVQKGPSFPKPVDMRIDASSGQVVVRYDGERGEQKVASEQMKLPVDLANGLIMTLLKNARPDAPPKSVGMVAATPKPRLVTLEIASAGEEPFSTAGAGRKATHYIVHVDIGGLSGLIAPLVGKQPPDSHVWILGGDTPAFVKAEQPFFLGGDVWRIELASPLWPKSTALAPHKQSK